MRSTPKRIGCIAVWLLVAAGAQVPGLAVAQDGPDLREILPYLMLVIDTSGSMERVPSCLCESAGCTECLPLCDLPNVSGVPPTDPPNDPDGRPLKKNRWATTLEALTGTFNDFQCTELTRESQNGASYDIGYFTPYHQPWDCASAGTACAFSTIPDSYQNENGILDLYASRVRFGLMTFDGMDTYTGVSANVPAADFDIPRSNAVYGLWSYGGPKPFNYPGCPYDYMMDTGARGPQAAEGSLISLDSCSGGGTPGGSTSCPIWCSSCTGAQDAINRDIEEALLSTRPFGGTPIAGSLDDLYFHFQNDLTDQFGNCRNRFALLVTDGEPDADHRSNHGCDCASNGTDPMRCGGDPTDPRYDPDLKKCPYPTAEEAARYLVSGRSATEPAMIERLFVVGMAVDDPGILTRLGMIADEGCLEPGSGACDAMFADDLTGLVQNLSAVINSLIEPISRSVPAFATGRQSTDIKQYQISTGFEVAHEVGQPWMGVVERRRFLCQNGDLVEDQLDTLEGDRFHETLNSSAASTRDLFTAMPPGNPGDGWGSIMGAMNGHLFTAASGAPCGTTGCPNQDFTRSLHPLNFGLTTTEIGIRDNIVDWMRGDAPVRSTRKLGDIYHSSPVIVGSPQFDTSDEAFNLFRQRTQVAGRPLTMYVGSNDGILHAFSVENYTSPTGYTPSRSYAAGEEMWGFVPPLLLDNVRDNLDRHTFSMDGTPLVKNVYLSRSTDAQATADQYRTVLITGMREGGHAYIALDVTNPVAPTFLWQFTDPQMGKTFAQPAIVQARYMVNVSGFDQPRQGAVAILPGGVGQAGALTGECSNGATNPTMRQPVTQTEYETMRDPNASSGVFEHRSDVRCWRDQGRALYFVEVGTGILLKKIYLDPANGNQRFFPSPLVGAPAAYPGDVGTLTSQAYLVDADGVIWRIDMSSPDQHGDDVLPHGEGADAEPRIGWTARPFHDVFFDAAGEDGISPPAAGELTYEAPILSVDNDGRVVVLVGTGDNNNFVKPLIRNRVVSLTEVLDTTMTGTAPERFKAAMNWEMRVRAGGTTGPRLTTSELVTGTMALFNGTLYFATFRAVTGADACDLGKGRIHAVHYRERDPSQPNDNSGTFAPRLIDGVALGASTSVINVTPDEAVDNLMLMGLGLTQRPSCELVNEDDFRIWGEDLAGIESLANPAVFLVAQGSGTTTQTSLLQDRAGSTLSNVELQVNKPTSLSRVVSWATSVD